MSCAYNDRGHVWRKIEELSLSRAGSITKNWDHALRACGCCGASGRVDKQGVVQLLWEPEICCKVVRVVEVPGHYTTYHCYLPAHHDGPHLE